MTPPPSTFDEARWLAVDRARAEARTDPRLAGPLAAGKGFLHELTDALLLPPTPAERRLYGDRWKAWRSEPALTSVALGYAAGLAIGVKSAAHDLGLTLEFVLVGTAGALQAFFLERPVRPGEVSPDNVAIKMLASRITPEHRRQVEAAFQRLAAQPDLAAVLDQLGAMARSAVLARAAQQRLRLLTADTPFQFGVELGAMAGRVLGELIVELVIEKGASVVVSRLRGIPDVPGGTPTPADVPGTQASSPAALDVPPAVGAAVDDLGSALDRLGPRFKPLEDALGFIAANPAARRGLERLAEKGHHDMIESLIAEVDWTPQLAREAAAQRMGERHAVRRRFTQLAELTDTQINGLDAVRVADAGGDIGRFADDWDGVLDLHAGWRDELLTLVGEVRSAVDGGLDAALKRGLAGPGSNIQGTLGHLFAARTLLRRESGARLYFEVPAVGREIDIRMRVGRRQFDVEVKTLLSLDETRDLRKLVPQIKKDLLRHIDDEWQDLLWLFAPQMEQALEPVRRAMLTLLRDPDVAQALQRAGISEKRAWHTLEARFRDDPKLVDTFEY